MAIPKTILFLLAIIILPCGAQAQKYLLSDFEETTLPKPGSNDWYPFLKGTYDFKVSTKRGKLKIGEYDSNNFDREVAVIVDNGRIVGTDEGEFGGELTFEDGGGNVTLIKKGNFRFIFNYKHEVYFIDSSAPTKYDTAHLETVYLGALYKLRWQNGAYTYDKIFDFDEWPISICIVNDDILLTSWNYCYKVHNLKKEIIFKRETIFSDTINWAFSFNSIAATDGRHIYLGANGGYLLLDPADKSYKYYKYKK